MSGRGGVGAGWMEGAIVQSMYKACVTPNKMSWPTYNVTQFRGIRNVFKDEFCEGSDKVNGQNYAHIKMA